MGDCALVPDRKTGDFHPPTAQHALRKGRIAAQNILATVRGEKMKPFSGFFAGWLWRTIYLFKLPRFEKKVLVALDWTLDVLFSKNLVHFHTTRSPIPPPVKQELPKSA